MQKITKLIPTSFLRHNSSRLRNLGKIQETVLKSGFESDVGKILLAQDISSLSIDYQKPEVMAHWMNKVAKEGPSLLNVNPSKTASPAIISVTGAAGNIAYALLPRIARGDLLGPDVPIILKLIELPGALKSLEGVKMELQDCAFPLLQEIIITSDLQEGFTGTDYAFFVGSKPRGKGQERSDVLKENALIFAEQGKYLSLYSSDNCKSIVVGNPANTNAMILSANAPNVNPANITAMTRLDHDRGLSAIASKLKCKISEIERFAIWGNHSATQYPDLTHTLVDGKWIGERLDFDWVYNTFIPGVQQRGAEIINARGKSSATSAANAALAHMRDWIHGISDWTSMAVRGSGQYGIPGNIWSSYPVFCTLGTWQIIEGMEIDEQGAKRINASVAELLSEREAVESLLPGKVWRGVPFDEKSVYSWSHLFDSASEKVQPTLLGDFEFQNAWKAQVGASLSFSDDFWNKITKEQVSAAVDGVDASKLKSNRVYTEREYKKIANMLKTVIWNEIGVLSRHVQSIQWDMEEYAKEEKWIQMDSAAKIKHQLAFWVRRDGVRGDGLNGVEVVTRALERLTK